MALLRTCCYHSYIIFEESIFLNPNMILDLIVEFSLISFFEISISCLNRLGHNVRHYPNNREQSIETFNHFRGPSIILMGLFDNYPSSHEWMQGTIIVKISRILESMLETSS